MRRELSDELAATARRRLDALARARAESQPEVPPGGDPPVGDPPGALTGPILTGPIPVPGRHARSRGVLRDDLLARVPDGLVAGLQRRHLGLLGLLAALAVLLAVWFAGRDAPRPMPVATTISPSALPTATPDRTGATTAPSTIASSTTGPGQDQAAAVVVVDVGGKVRRPLVATLPAGSRVIDALRRAGGARPGVDLTPLNLARVLVDGEQILVGIPAPRLASGPAGESRSTAPAGAPVNLNSASVDALEGLPGVGPVTAQKIVDWRTENGPFSSADELLEVDGIGPKTLASIAPQVTW